MTAILTTAALLGLLWAGVQLYRALAAVVDIAESTGRMK